MFHSRDSPRLLVCDTGLYLEQNDIGFITVAICGGYISKYPGLYGVFRLKMVVNMDLNLTLRVRSNCPQNNRGSYPRCFAPLVKIW